MKSSSLKIIRDMYPDISARAYRDTLIHEWHIPEEYKPIIWLLETVKIHTHTLRVFNNDGIIKYKQRKFNITWISGPRTVDKNTYALVSFRWCDKLQAGYVLIKAYIEDGIDNNIALLNERHLEK